MNKKFIPALVLIISFTMCKTQKNVYTPDYTPGPAAIVYKTKKDYSKNVPVILSEDKSEIVGYFSPKDLIRNEKVKYPDTLNNGYLLDNIGINQNVAYTSLIIDSYTKSMQVISVNKLFELIIDNDPLTEMYNCGNKGKMNNPIENLNNIIDKRQLKYCKKLK